MGAMSAWEVAYEDRQIIKKLEARIRNLEGERDNLQEKVKKQEVVIARYRNALSTYRSRSR